MNDLRCYVCGKDIGDKFSLVSMSKNVDRVFIVEDKCVKLVKDDAENVVPVVRRTP